uniref:Uncharacterized protein n=1 Tax=Craspedostauros australis TaxID=1486917 RepID=A0A7R9WPF2_9STRA
MLATITDASITSIMGGSMSERSHPERQEGISFPKDLFSTAEAVSCMSVNDTMQCKSCLKRSDFALLQSRDPSTKAKQTTMCLRELKDDATYSYSVYVLDTPQYKDQQPIIIRSHKAYKQAVVCRLKANSKEYGVFMPNEDPDCLEAGGRLHYIPKYFIQSQRWRCLFSRLRWCKVSASPSVEERQIYLSSTDMVNGSKAQVAAVATTRASSSSKSHATSTVTKSSFRSIEEQRFWIAVCAICDEMDKDDDIYSV